MQTERNAKQNAKFLFCIAEVQPTIGVAKGTNKQGKSQIYLGFSEPEIRWSDRQSRL